GWRDEPACEAVLQDRRPPDLDFAGTALLGCAEGGGGERETTDQPTDQPDRCRARLERPVQCRAGVVVGTLPGAGAPPRQLAGRRRPARDARSKRHRRRRRIAQFLAQALSLAAPARLVELAQALELLDIVFHFAHRQLTLQGFAVDGGFELVEGR